MPGEGGGEKYTGEKRCVRAVEKRAAQILSGHGLSLSLARARKVARLFTAADRAYFSLPSPKSVHGSARRIKNTGRGGQGRLNPLAQPRAHTIFLSSRWLPRDVLWPAARVFRGRHYFSVLNSVIPGTMERLKRKI